MWHVEELTVGQLVAARPAGARILENLGLDYCCGGKQPLRDACRERGLDVKSLLAQVDAAKAGPDAGEEDWQHTSSAELCAHIVSAHHGYLRRELPRLLALSEKVSTVHAAAHPELTQVHAILGHFKAELEQHMFKEEQILFPMCQALEHATSAPSFHCGSVANPIAVMEREHDDAGDALRAMRSLTHDFTPPGDACISYKMLLLGLAELEGDMHRHVHEENNILFPRAAAREAELSTTLRAEDHAGLDRS